MPSNLPAGNNEINSRKSTNDNMPTISEIKAFDSSGGTDSIPLKNDNCEEINEENEPLILDE